MVRIYVIFALVSGLNAFPDIAQEEFIRANELMKQEEYPSAVNIYEGLLGQGYKHPDLYYNLGNGYFKQGKYGLAIWAYETGLKLNPLDKDILFNLRLTETRIRDRIREPDPFILLKFYRSLKYRMHVYDGLLLGSLFLFMTAIIQIIIKYTKSSSSVTSRFVGIFLLFSLICHGITLDKYWGLSSTTEGVVVVPECNAYSIPLERPESTVFILHEGTKGSVTQEQEDWLEIELIDGNKGWVKSNRIRKI